VGLFGMNTEELGVKVLQVFELADASGEAVHSCIRNFVLSVHANISVEPLLMIEEVTRSPSSVVVSD